MCVASAVSRRKQRPGATTAMGGGCDVIVSHLHRRSVRAQHGRHRLAPIHIERVVHVTGGMAEREVEGGEVVPLGVYLWAVGYGIAHPHEQVFQGSAGLGDDVGVAGGYIADDFGEVGPLGLQEGGSLGFGEFAVAGVQQSCDLAGGFFAGAPGFGAVVCAEAADGAPQCCQPGRPAEQICFDFGERVCGIGVGNGGSGCCEDFSKLRGQLLRRDSLLGCHREAP